MGCSCGNSKGKDHAFIPIENPKKGEPPNINRQLPFKISTGRPLLRRVHGYYEHHTLHHLLAQMRAYGPPIRFSSWVIEAANKVWKAIFATQVNWGWRNKLHIDSEYHPGRQALKRFLRIVYPGRRHLSMKDVRMRNPYRCGCCDLIKEDGHLGRNPDCRDYFRNR